MSSERREWRVVCDQYIAPIACEHECIARDVQEAMRLLFPNAPGWRIESRPVGAWTAEGGEGEHE